MAMAFVQLTWQIDQCLILSIFDDFTQRMLQFLGQCICGGGVGGGKDQNKEARQHKWQSS